MTSAASAAHAPGAELLDYDDVIARYDPVLGLEVHVELSTATKMFCGCANEFGAEPNTQVCPVCLGLPGSLPVLNEAAVESAIRIGLALNCDIAPWGRFARKNYFYPDQPKNYQISQYDEPIAVQGYLDVPLDDGTTFRVEIERAHMEEDTGKLTHLGSDTGRIAGATTSLADYNRAGVPLIEIVTKPIEGTADRAPEIARAYVTALRDLLRSLDVSDVRMDQGSMRCDVNVSLKPKGAGEFGTRTETKNVNSLKSVEVAVRYEMRRQGAVLDSGGRVIQETRHFHEDGYTSSGRTKETAEDYRYFPEPDLEPVAPSRDLVERLPDDREAWTNAGFLASAAGDKTLERRRVAHMRLQQFRGNLVSHFGHISVRFQFGDIEDQFPRERIAIGMQTRRRQRQQGVAGFYGFTRQKLFLLHHSDNKSRQIIFARRIKARHFRGFSANQSATRLAAGTAHSVHNLLHDICVQFSHRQIIQEKQRLRALHQNVVHAMIHQVAADG